MKKLLMSLVCLFALVALVACGQTNEEQKPENPDNGGTTTPTEATYKLGMGIVVAEEGEASNGALLVSSTVAAVVTDKDGKIVACRIDALQNKIKVEEGEAVSNNTTSKAELGENYNMSKYGASMDWNGDGKVLEWYLQAQAFENFVKGMTATEVAAMTTQKLESGYVISDNEDLLKAGCTIQIDEFKAAIAKACADEFAVEFKTAKEFKLGVAINGELNEKDTTAEVAALYSEYACTVVVEDKIVATLNDAIQPKLGFTAAGELGELEFKGTKRELKEEYNMAKYGQSMDWNGDGKVLEWYVQSAEFSKFITGMTAAEVTAMTTQKLESGYVISDNADLLKAGCTIQITGMKAVVVDAVTNAR